MVVGELELGDERRSSNVARDDPDSEGLLDGDVENQVGLIKG